MKSSDMAKIMKGQTLSIQVENPKPRNKLARNLAVAGVLGGLVVLRVLTNIKY